MFYIYKGKAYYSDGTKFYDTKIADRELLISAAPTADIVEKERVATSDMIKMIYDVDVIRKADKSEPVATPKRRGKNAVLNVLGEE